MIDKIVLDACCGSKMFWFDNDNPITTFADVRNLDTNLCDGRVLKVEPDVISNFTNMIFNDEQFKMVVFDPPHLERAGPNGWQALKYGKLETNWRDDFKKAFIECFRVLQNDGVLIFKWNETQIKVSEILSLCNYKPMFGHISGKRSNTHWITFIKNESMIKVTDE